jgi:hypothetical protein
MGASCKGRRQMDKAKQISLTVFILAITGLIIILSLLTGTSSAP